jgi:hypothetical protein
MVIASGSPVLFWLAFDRELTGYVAFDVEAAAGTRLDITFEESLGAGGPSESYVLPGGRWTHESMRLQGFEFLQVRITFPGGGHCRTPLRIHRLAAAFTSFPVAYEGRFECSDELLNRVWRFGRWTTQLCMQSYHLDSPIHQEGLGCTGDYMIEALVGAYCFGETRLARQDILRTAYLLRQKRGRMFHTSYSLLWVRMVRDYWMHTGDAATVRAVLPEVRRLLARFGRYTGPSGLITAAPNYMFMDWIELDGFALHHPPASIGQGYMSAFYYRALLDAADMSRALGRPGAGAAWGRRAAAVAEAFNRELWVPERGLYCDGIPFASKVKPNPWLPADPGRRTFSLHTNAAAVDAGLVPPARRARVMRRAMRERSLPAAQPYFMHFVFAALAEAGLYDEFAFAEMRKWRRLLDEHPTSLKEAWDFGDYSHAWSATPTFQLSARVLGVEPLEPGFGVVRIAPRLGDLKWAKGTVPTCRGPIEVSWARRGNAIRGTLRGPPGMRVRIGAGADPRGRARAASAKGAPHVGELVLEPCVYDIRIRPGSMAETAKSGLQA